MMKKEWQSGGLCLLILGGLLAGCLSGCRSTEPLPDKVATTGVHTVSTTATAPVDTTTKAPSKTNPDPTGYEDVGYDDEDWPWRVFYSVEGFVHWIENPNLKAEKNPLKPEKDEYGLDVYKKSYFDAMYPDYQQMFAADRFYMLPVVPSDWKLDSMYINRYEVGFFYLDSQKNEYCFVYQHSQKTSADIIEKEADTLFVKEIDGQKYYISDYLSELSPKKEKRGYIIKTFIDGYLCYFIERLYDPSNKDATDNGYTAVVYTKDTDLTDVVSKIKFRRIDLPPLEQ
jgi:hypothetical protein